jgi:hypothetical protein
MSLADAAKLDRVVDTIAPNFHRYNCHMAVIFWALLEMEDDDQKAQDGVQKIARHHCNHCRGVGNCNSGPSLDNMKYGNLFCRDLGTKLGAAPTANDVEVGDVVFISHPSFPIHSMVVVEKGEGNRIGIRGWNNKGTFSDAPFLKYDPVTRWLDERPNPNDNIVYRIREADFLRRVSEVTKQIDLERNAQAKSKSCTIL